MQASFTIKAARYKNVLNAAFESGGGLHLDGFAGRVRNGGGGRLFAFPVGDLDVADDRLAADIDMNVLDRDLLLAAAAAFFQDLDLAQVERHQPLGRPYSRPSSVWFGSSARRMQSIASMWLAIIWVTSIASTSS